MPTGPQNAILGETYGTDLPETEMEETQLTEEKNKARFSKSKEYQVLKEHIEGRIAFYQVMLPDGREIGLTTTPTPEEWMVANRVIAEFNAILNAYEQANQVVEDAAKRKAI